MSESQPYAYGGASGPRADFGQRFVAMLIDWVVVVIPGFILIFVLAAIAKGFGLLLGYLILLVGGIGYYIYFEGGPTGQTIGKKAMKIRVVDMTTGGPLGSSKAFIRYLGRIASGAICYLGYFWAIWDKEKQTWHDKIAGTVVVPEAAYPVQQ